MKREITWKRREDFIMTRGVGEFPLLDPCLNPLPMTNFLFQLRNPLTMRDVLFFMRACQFLCVASS
jgi:hypothetical protein